MRQLITALSRLTAARRLARLLSLHKVGNWWLGRFPIVKALPGSGVIYRARRLESVPLSHEIFETANLYDAGLLPKNLTTFADLGCNVGYFTCWLAHLSRRKDLKGLMLDANPEAVKEACWHAQVNQLNQVFGIHGILGETHPSGALDFYLYESNICSTSQLPDVAQMGLPGKWTKISVPIIRLEDEWQKRFGDLRCHLLKIDIEGSELNFLQEETLFLRRTDSLLVEWHKWRVKFDDMKNLLSAHGFEYMKTLEESETMGTAFFRRKY